MPEQARKLRGRPRKTLLDRRAATVAIRLKLDEAAQLDLFAAEAGMTTSEYLRSRAFANQQAPNLAPALRHDLYRLLLAVQRGLHDGVPAPTLAARMQAVIDRLQA